MALLAHRLSIILQQIALPGGDADSDVFYVKSNALQIVAAAFGKRIPRNASDAVRTIARKSNGKLPLDVLPLLMQSIGLIVEDSVWDQCKQALVSRLQEAMSHDPEPGRHEQSSSVATASAGGSAIVPSLDPERQKYACLDKETLISLVLRLNAEILDLKSKLGTLRTFAHRAKRKFEKIEQEQETEPDTQFELLRKRKGVQLTPQGTLAVAIRRNMSNIACADLGKVMLDDISRHTASRCEIKAAAALLASTHAFFDGMRAYMVSQRPSFGVNAFRSDATNSAIWQRRKLCALELETAYLQTTDLKQACSSLGDSLVKIKRIADVLAVTSGSGAGAVGMLSRHLDSLHCPLWSNWERFSTCVYVPHHNCQDSCPDTGVLCFCVKCAGTCSICMCKTYNLAHNRQDVCPETLVRTSVLTHSSGRLS